MDQVSNAGAGGLVPVEDDGTAGGGAAGGGAAGGEAGNAGSPNANSDDVGCALDISDIDDCTLE